MKKFFVIAIAMMTTIACTKQTQTESQETETVQEVQAEVKSLFNEENIPAEGLNLNEYSKGFQHIGLPTINVQATIDFYKGLGFELATRHDIDGRDFAFMKLGDLLIEVIPVGEPAMVNGAVDHFCLDVKNIDQLYTAVKEAGYNVVDEHVNEIAFWKNGAKYFFIIGPNNEKIEFCEVL